MILEYIRYEVSDSRAFVDAYERARSALDSSPHCLAYELSRCTDDERSFILRIEWTSMEGHLEGFRKSPEFAAFFRAVQPFLQAIREMRHYELTAIACRK